MTLFRIMLITFLVSCSGSLYASESVISKSAKIVDEFLDSLPGTWIGQAIETPVGPVNYNINFNTCDSGRVAGVAELNVSDHHWQFWKSNDEIRLTFMSTFRGNKKPTQLVVVRKEGNTFNFNAPELALLTLSVTFVEPHVDIRVFHYLKPHVYIRLTRSDRTMSEGELAKRKLKSCKILSD